MGPNDGGGGNQLSRASKKEKYYVICPLEFGTSSTFRYKFLGSGMIFKILNLTTVIMLKV